VAAVVRGCTELLTTRAPGQVGLAAEVKPDGQEEEREQRVGELLEDG
jgi:hypothetical protein